MGSDWDKVTFFETKRNLTDGSNNFICFWYDFCKDIYSKRQFSKSAKGTNPITFIQVGMTVDTYVDMQAEIHLPETPLITSEDYLFQQDNAFIHILNTAKSQFAANIVKLLKFRDTRLDLISTKNLLDILAQKYTKMSHNSKRRRNLFLLFIRREITLKKLARKKSVDLRHQDLLIQNFLVINMIWVP